MSSIHTNSNDNFVTFLSWSLNTHLITKNTIFTQNLKKFIITYFSVLVLLGVQRRHMKNIKTTEPAEDVISQASYMTYSTTVSDHSVNYGPANWEKVTTTSLYFHLPIPWNLSIYLSWCFLLLFFGLTFSLTLCLKRPSLICFFHFTKGYVSI